MPKIKHYSVSEQGVNPSNTGATLFFEQGLRVHTTTTPQESLTLAEKMIKKALHDDNLSIYLVGPSDETTINKKGEKVSHLMIAVIDYRKKEPQSHFIKMRTYETAGGVQEGYRIETEPKDFSTFRPGLQEQYAAIVAHEQKQYEQLESSSSDDQYLSDAPESEDSMQL